jgi:hypothetical protein
MSDNVDQQIVATIFSLQSRDHNRECYVKDGDEGVCPTKLAKMMLIRNDDTKVRITGLYPSTSKTVQETEDKEFDDAVRDVHRRGVAALSHEEAEHANLVLSYSPHSDALSNGNSVGLSPKKALLVAIKLGARVDLKTLLKCHCPVISSTKSRAKFYSLLPDRFSNSKRKSLTPKDFEINRAELRVYEIRCLGVLIQKILPAAKTRLSPSPKKQSRPTPSLPSDRSKQARDNGGNATKNSTRMACLKDPPSVARNCAKKRKDPMVPSPLQVKRSNTRSIATKDYSEIETLSALLEEMRRDSVLADTCSLLNNILQEKFQGEQEHPVSASASQYKQGAENWARHCTCSKECTSCKNVISLFGNLESFLYSFRDPWVKHYTIYRDDQKNAADRAAAKCEIDRMLRKYTCLTDVMELFFVIQRADFTIKRQRPWLSRSKHHKDFRESTGLRPTVDLEIIDMAFQMAQIIEQDTGASMDFVLKSLLQPIHAEVRMAKESSEGGGGLSLNDF